MYYYASRVGNGKRGKLFQPELITDRIMVNPSYFRIKNILPCSILCDSGAFQDIHLLQRLTPMQALDRQFNLLDRLQMPFEAIATYDQMAGIDEAIVDGRKVKIRGNEESATKAVHETLLSAAYYKVQQDTINSHIIYVAQGIHTKQYTKCTDEILTLMRTTDYFGFGGFCIIGRQRKTMLPLFMETVTAVLPMLYKKGIQRVHVFGVCVPNAVRYLHEESKKYSIIASTDSSAPEFAATFAGAQFIEGKQITPKIRNNPFWRPYEHYHPVDLAMENVKNYHDWITNL